ncbi:GPI-anchored surface protein, putative [Bodo saltans]|uniref:GPI-anchored surface protein, putative n=1 Tax=Bodo saltans TaxID=75058 RepID=A0A0S4KLU1_BODSA|nr:GPI-anchored surface protein, putative [Bodo saltans]|eukprot:CUI15383.1 GPI-anchored surface protein, putative [Bodo saltans]
MPVSIALILTCVALAASLSSAALTTDALQRLQEEDTAQQQFCGALPSIQAANALLLIANLTLNSDGSFSIVASL